MKMIFVFLAASLSAQAQDLISGTDMLNEIKANKDKVIVIPPAGTSRVDTYTGSVYKTNSDGSNEIKICDYVSKSKKTVLKEKGDEVYVLEEDTEIDHQYYVQNPTPTNTPCDHFLSVSRRVILESKESYFNFILAIFDPNLLEIMSVKRLSLLNYAIMQPAESGDTSVINLNFSQGLWYFEAQAIGLMARQHIVDAQEMRLELRSSFTASEVAPLVDVKSVDLKDVVLIKGMGDGTEPTQYLMDWDRSIIGQ